jgi:DNA-binding Lrp family transcriptional regulator
MNARKAAEVVSGPLGTRITENEEDLDGFGQGRHLPIWAIGAPSEGYLDTISMLPRGTATDRTDFDIYRALFLEQEARFWGSRSVVDPRISVAEVARRVGLSRTTVQARLRSWKDAGFLIGYEVWPNPRLFDVELCTVDIPVETPAHVDLLLSDLSLIEGVVSARGLLDEDGRTVRAYLVDDGGVGLGRRRRLIRRVAGLATEPEVHPYWLPECDVDLSPLDWRILSFYRSYPEAGLTEGAKNLGITAKTLSSRRDRLLDYHAMWWLLTTNSSRFPAASFFITVSEAARVSSVRTAMEGISPGWIPCADDGFGVRPTPTLSIVAGLVMVESPASVDDLARQISRVPGVAAVRWRIPREFRGYPEWYDRHLLARLGSHPERRGHFDDGELSAVPPSPTFPATGASLSVDSTNGIAPSGTDGAIPPILPSGSDTESLLGFVARRTRRVTTPQPSL